MNALFFKVNGKKPLKCENQKFLFLVKKNVKNKFKFNFYKNGDKYYKKGVICCIVCWTIFSEVECCHVGQWCTGAGAERGLNILSPAPPGFLVPSPVDTPALLLRTRQARKHIFVENQSIT